MGPGPQQATRTSLGGMPAASHPTPPATDPALGPWLLLIYKLPSDSSHARVTVWRQLKRLGALYVQQAVCVLPDRPELRESLGKVRRRLDELGGSSIFLTLTEVEDEAREKFVEGLRDQSAKEYAEIIEECDTKFVKEIEFERFRDNFTFEEAEEIRQDLEKLRRWLKKVEARDWMGAGGRDVARQKVSDCERLLEEFEADVYERTIDSG